MMIAAMLLIPLTGQAQDLARSSEPRGTTPVFIAQDASTVEFNIPPQPLGAALTAFADQANYRLLFTSDMTEGKYTEGVTGRYAPADALAMLLTGAGLSFRFADERTVTIERGATDVTPPPTVEQQGPSPAPESPPPTAEPAKRKPVKMPEMVVKEVRRRDDTTYVAEEASTATRTETPLIETPVSVEVVTQKVIQDQRAIRMEQALRNVSGMAIAYTSLGSGSDQLFCRGFLCDWFKNNLRNTSTQQVLTFRDIANIQRIEVLKGPPSVLYGRNAPGGILNIITKQPLPEQYASLDTIIGSYGLYRTMMDLSSPLNDSKTVGVRLNLAYENHESYRDFVHGQRYFVAPVFKWELGNNTTLTFEGEYIRDNQTYDPGLPAVGQGVAPVPNSRFLGEPFNNIKTEENRSGFILNHRFNDSLRLESLFRADRSSQSALIVFQSNIAADGQTLPRFVDRFDVNIESYYWRNDLIGKLVTGSIKHTVLSGVELGRQFSSDDEGTVAFNSINIYNPIYGQSAVPNIPADFRVHSFANSVGTYVQDQIDLLDNLHLLAGGRLDYFYQHTNRLGIETKSEHWGISPRIGLTYQPMPWIALYSNFTRSFNPTFSLFQASNNQLIPQTGTQYEAGIKTDIVPGRLTSTLAIYRIVQKNVPTADPSSPLRQVQTGEQQSQGVEFDLTAQLTPEWKVITTYAYTDARVTLDNTFRPGNRLPRIPRHTGSFWSTYDFQHGPLQGFGAGVGLFAVGERAGDFQNSFELPGYVRTDAALYYRKPEVFTRTNLTAQLNIINLFDQDYYSGGNGLRSIGAAFPGAPLTFMGSIKLEFY